MLPNVTFLGLYLYDICILIGVLVAFFLADRLVIKSGFSLKLQRLVIVAAFLAVVVGYGSAVLFQAFYNFLDTGVFSLRSGATFYGGLIGGVAVYLLVWFIGGKKYCDDNEQITRFPEMLSIGACCVPLAHAFGRIGCLFAGCCHGQATDAWYGITMLTNEGWVKVVPVHIFEALFLFALSAVLIILFVKKPAWKLPLMSFYCGIYGIWRFVIEFFRGDERGKTIVSFLSPSQLTAVLLILFAIGYLVFWIIKRKKMKKESAV